MSTRVELCNVDGRASLACEGRVIDIEARSGGNFSSDPMSVLGRWDDLCDWAQVQRPHESDALIDPARLGPCVPRPRQLFAIGLNYRDHANEAGLQIPEQPMVFTKFPSCLAGPRTTIALGSESVDFEIELVVVIGCKAHGVSEAHALEHVAGYCVGQDISDRKLQFASVPPQFSLAKSCPAYGPLGPTLVASRHVEPSAVALHCDVNGTRMQSGKSSDMIFPVPTIIEYLSRHCELFPGDVIFTGTPSGVGSMRKPRQYLKPGDLIRSEIPGLGVLENRCVAR